MFRVTYLEYDSVISALIQDFIKQWNSESDTLECQTSGSTGTPKLIHLQKSHMRHSARTTGDFFNFSPIKGLKFFIEKNDETLTPIKLLFYENEIDYKEIIIKIGETIHVGTINDYMVFDLGFNKLNPQQVTITVDSVEYDITNIILNLKHSFLGIE